MLKYRFIFVFLWLWVGLVVNGQAQIYHIYRPEPDLSIPEEVIPRDPVVELAYAPLWSAGEINDKDLNTISHYMLGHRVGVFGLLSKEVNVGLEWESVRALAHHIPYISYIKRDVFAFTTKWLLTPQTSPRLYFITSVGYARQASKFELQRKHFTHSNLTLAFGMGLKVLLWKRLYLDGEFRQTLECKKWDNFVFSGPSERYNLSLGLSYQY